MPGLFAPQGDNAEGSPSTTVPVGSADTCLVTSSQSSPASFNPLTVLSSRGLLQASLLSLFS